MNKTTITTLQICILSLGLVFCPLGIWSQNQPSAQELLDLPLDKAHPLIENLGKEESKELISQIRAIARTNNPDLDKVYFLVSHLEEIQAVEKEQARLASLVWVYGLGFILFSVFLSYLLFEQRKIYRDIQRSAK